MLAKCLDVMFLSGIGSLICIFSGGDQLEDSSSAADDVMKNNTLDNDSPGDMKNNTLDNDSPGDIPENMEHESTHSGKNLRQFNTFYNR